MADSPVALVTGASSGIGENLAFGLAEDGYQVVLGARSEGQLKKVAERISSDLLLTSKRRPVYYPVDVADDQQVEQVVRDVENRFRRIDVLLNSAGRGGAGSLDLDVDEFDRLLAVNLRGPFVFMKHVVPIMRKQRSGYIINIASRNGKVGIVGKGGYAASKFGLVGLSEVVYRELAAEGIKVTTICPGWVNTEMATRGGCPHPADEIIQPSDIWRTVRWLLDLGPAVSIMEVLLECSVDVERRSTIENTKKVQSFKD